MVKSAACRKSRVGRADDVARQVLVGSRCKMETVETVEACRYGIPVPSPQETAAVLSPRPVPEYAR